MRFDLTDSTTEGLVMTGSVYRLVYPDGSYHEKFYHTKGRAKQARTLLNSEDDLKIEKLSGDWVTVDSGQPELYGRLRMLDEFGVSRDVKSRVEYTLRHLTEDQLTRVHLHKMSEHEVALETSEAVVYATPGGYRHSGFKVYDLLVPGILMGKR